MLFNQSAVYLIKKKISYCTVHLLSSRNEMLCSVNTHKLYEQKVTFHYSIKIFPMTGVIWYFEPHGKLNPGSIYIHGILNPLIEN